MRFSHFSAICIAFVGLVNIGNAQDINDARVLSNLRACYEAQTTVDGMRACIGQAALACQDETEGGYSTLGLSQCQWAEAKAWDVLLNEAYGAAMAAAKGGDDADRDTPEFARRAETLRAMQRAWIPFRDAKCAAEYAKWGMGSMRHIAASGCLMQTNAEQTIQLWAMFDAFR